MANHAVLSASSSHRWMNCPPSVRLTEQIADNGSVYAAEGSEAHSLCEYKLRRLLGMDAENPLDCPGGLQYYDSTMEDAANSYAAYVMELLEDIRQTCADPIVMVEQRLNFSRWVKDGFGTGDWWQWRLCEFRISVSVCRWNAYETYRRGKRSVVL